MFPLSHTYVSTEVTNSRDSLLVFGSILPDIATVSGGRISRDKIHSSSKDFLEFIKSDYPQLIKLAIGVNLHTQEGRGADYYSDDADVGFAKLEGKQFVPEVKALLNTADEKIGLVIAHNLVEAGVDLNLKDNYPKILEIYKESLENVNFEFVAECLSDYLDLKKDEVLKELQNFTNLLSPKNLSTTKNMNEHIAVPLLKIKLRKDVDLEESEKILKRAKEATQDNFKKYLDNAVEKMKVDFDYLFKDSFL